MPPPPDRKLEIPLIAKREGKDFILSYRGHTINLSKRSHHLRTQKVIGLARLDLDGPRHTNPDGKQIGKRHLHLYRENFDLKWAFEVPSEYFKNLDDPYRNVYRFLEIY